MPPHLSTRISIRWLPEAASEPTDTLVIGVGDYYMDLRMTKADATIDWAMAGQRIVLSEDPAKVQFTHIIDSRGYTEPDQGTFSQLPNGDDLETGTMPCPEKGNVMTDYEEVWRDLPVTGESGGRAAWIVQSVDDVEGTTFVGRLGNAFMAFRKSRDGSFFAKREEWGEKENRWQTKYLVGDHSTPWLEGAGDWSLREESSWSVGEVVHDLKGVQYRVRAFEALKP